MFVYSFLNILLGGRERLNGVKIQIKLLMLHLGIVSIPNETGKTIGQSFFVLAVALVKASVGSRMSLGSLPRWTLRGATSTKAFPAHRFVAVSA
jgi:hypothetical protein